MVKKMLIKYCSAEMRGSEKIVIFESKKRLLHIIKGIMKKEEISEILEKLVYFD